MIPLRMVFSSPDYPEEEKGPKKTWVYGPSWKIEKVDVGIERFAFRQKDPTSLLISNNKDIGSCPYAFTFDKSDEKWHLEDHILFNLNDITKEGFDKIPLKRFDGRLKIKELDPETSHIDMIQIDHVSDEGKVTHYAVDHAALTRVDETYFTMNQGDEITLTFKDFVPNKGGRYYLISKGYYEVYENSTR